MYAMNLSLDCKDDTFESSMWIQTDLTNIYTLAKQIGFVIREEPKYNPYNLSLWPFLKQNHKDQRNHKEYFDNLFGVYVLIRSMVLVLQINTSHSKY